MRTTKTTRFALALGALLVGASTSGCPDEAQSLGGGASRLRMPPWSYDEFEVFEDYPDIIDDRHAPEPAASERPAPMEDASSPWDVRAVIVARDWRYIVVHHSATN